MNADSNTQKSVFAHPWVQLILGMTFNLIAAALGLFVLKPMRARHFAAVGAEVAGAPVAALRAAMQPSGN